MKQALVERAVSGDVQEGLGLLLFYIMLYYALQNLIIKMKQFALFKRL